MGTLLLLADAFPDRAAVQLNLPGLRRDLPAYLQVIKEELDWMLKMQRADGAVFHKVTPMGFGGFVRGQDNVGGELFVFEPSTPDTAVFAAVMAEAARVYQMVDKSYARRLLDAAELSWRWLGQQPKSMLPADMEGTGAYLYADDKTQRFWAAAELFKTTGDLAYGEYARKYLQTEELSIQPLGWSNTLTFGILAYYFNERADAGLRQRIADTFRTWADGMTTTVQSSVNPWRVSISVYAWASNKAALDNASLLLIANQIAPKNEYVECALEQLHYILGRNVLHKSYVTGYGFDPVKNPHNRTMFALGRIVPGVLVGGPNGDAQDGISPTAEGPRSYVDDLRAYSANENSIEYNAPLVFLTAFAR
jgi:endoglucanase